MHTFTPQSAQRLIVTFKAEHMSQIMRNQHVEKKIKIEQTHVLCLSNL